MKRTNFQNLGQAIDDFFKNSGLEHKIKEIQIKENWKTIVGPVFAKATKRISLFKGVLFVTIDSPSIKHELLLNRTILIQRLNESVKKQIVYEIVIR